ncbi:hypothetical protein L915_14224 [Phytophthora nicotianae]|nr:hypothetical protein L915_14224 [Phytophthora nicotianae]ETL33412.1 hypothetical protein L916_14123 [Phytophthora nicotianae]ETM39880.1 hypothetical protein L914_14027 [Phytophthora nicotianae]
MSSLSRLDEHKGVARQVAQVRTAWRGAAHSLPAIQAGPKGSIIAVARIVPAGIEVRGGSVHYANFATAVWTRSAVA